VFSSITITTCRLAGVCNLTVIAAVPDFEASCVLVAVTVALAGAVGAVNKPFASIDPALALHATAEL
jgi:hypothetical protein